MPKWLIGLVAITCIVVIGSAGFWTWKTQGDQAANMAAAKFAANSSACRALLKDEKTGTKAHTVGEAAFCVGHHFLSDDDMVSIGGQALADKVKGFIAQYGS